MNMRMTKQRNGTRQTRHRRKRAAAVVEFAVVLPLLLTILFGIIEYGYVFMVRQSLQTAAREGCRVAVLQTSNNEDIVKRVKEVLRPALGDKAYSVTIDHANPEAGKLVETIEVQIPYNDVSLMGGFFGTHDYNLAGTCSMRKEGV